MKRLPEALRIAEGLKVISAHVQPNAVHLGEGVIDVRCGAGVGQFSEADVVGHFNQADIDVLEAMGWLWNGVSCCWQWKSQNP